MCLTGLKLLNQFVVWLPYDVQMCILLNYFDSLSFTVDVEVAISVFVILYGDPVFLKKGSVVDIVKMDI